MHFIVSFFLVQYVHSVMQTSDQLPKWDNFFKYARIGILTMVATYYIANSPEWFGWLWNLLLLGLLCVF